MLLARFEPSRKASMGLRSLLSRRSPQPPDQPSQPQPSGSPRQARSQARRNGRQDPKAAPAKPEKRRGFGVPLPNVKFQLPRIGKRNRRAPAAGGKSATPGLAATAGKPAGPWEEVPPYLPVDPAEHPHVCAVAAAIAAGDRPTSQFSIKRLSVANPEYRRVTVVASALAAGALENSSFVVKRIYRKTGAESAPLA